MKIYLSDTGTVFRVSVGVDLTDATYVGIKLKKPSGATLDLEADIEAPATNGIIVYTITNELDQAGTWTLQSSTVFPDGEWSGDSVSFIVYEAYT